MNFKKRAKRSVIKKSNKLSHFTDFSYEQGGVYERIPMGMKKIVYVYF